jgi:hypothetical protein
MSAEPVKTPSSGALRTRLYRERRRLSLRCLRVELHQKEIDGLVDRGYLARADGENPRAMVRAVHKFLDDEFSVEKWREARQAAAQLANTSPATNDLQRASR